MIFVVIPGVIYLWAYVKLTDKVSKPLFDNPQHVNSDTALDQDLIQASEYNRGLIRAAKMSTRWHWDGFYLIHPHFANFAKEIKFGALNKIGAQFLGKLCYLKPTLFVSYLLL